MLFAKVSRNVEATVGVPYEIIGIDNSNGELGICAAYNNGARQSKYNVLCFMHEDILIHTSGWGGIIEAILADEAIGLTGVTGSKYMVDAPSPWWGGSLEFCRRNVIENYQDGHTEHILQNPDNLRQEEVVAIDGLFMCTRKEVWQDNPFDEVNFPQFHIYDIDFSAQISRRYKIVVTYELLIEHFSQGSFNKGWIAGSVRFYEKWKHRLPVSVAETTVSQRKKIRGNAWIDFCSSMLKAGSDPGAVWRCLASSIYYSHFSRRNLWMIRALLLKRKR